MSEMDNVQEMDRAYIAHTYGRFPLVLKEGHGSVCRDENGKEYIDLGSGIAVTSFGFGDETWVKAVEAQLHMLQHTSNLYYTEPCARLAQMLCERTGMKKVFFSNSGAESNECLIKVARKWAMEHRGAEYSTIVTMKGSFHGRTLTTLAATGQEHYHELFQPLTPGFLHVTPEDTEELEAVLRKEKVAGVLLECIQGEGGVIELSRAYLQAVEELCRKYGCLLLVDEVQTGNGRTGKLYAYMHADLHPDVVSTAKGLAGGLPLGATLMAERVQDVLGPGDHGSTFGGNPVCAAGALSILERLSDEMLRDIAEKGQMVRELLQGQKGILSISGKGLMLGIETEKAAGQVVRECMDAGVLCLTAKDKVRLLPALNIDRDVLKKGVEILREVVAS
ncbi:MAG: acetylornithine/succinylornithine family transaminase [Clostridia bacterium]|nr:acetylornithine/succinylornithine family transaminase [Clostridia bacterium]